MSTALKTQPTPRFAPRAAFSRALDREATAYFEGSGRARRDVPQMYLKSAVMLVWFVSSWTLLVFFAKTGAEGVFAAISLGLSIAGIGMSVQHDGNHGASSKHGWINRVFGSTLDVMGVCSFIWRAKHNVGHHTFTNIQQVDYDLDFGGLARLSPEQPHRAWHRYQHLYLWAFYGFLLPKWVFYDDFVILQSGFVGQHAVAKPSRAKLAAFVGWKFFFIMWAIAIPAMFHPLWQVLVFHLVACFALGGTLGTIFQLAHCARAVEYPISTTDTRMEEWTAHQLATTVDFAKSSRILSWFVGGLNFQVEHHLFPKVSHVHYPALAKIVERLAIEHGVQYRSHISLGAALASHFSHLRELSRPIVKSPLVSLATPRLESSLALAPVVVACAADAASSLSPGSPTC